MKKRKATIKDVASLSGVSTATVSHVLNGTKNISAKVQEQVYRAIDQLQYQPNNIAKSLRVQKTRTIGVMISDITNPFFSLVVKAIENEFALYKYNVLLCNTDQNSAKEKMYLDILLGKRVDGLIVSSASGEGEHFQNLNGVDIPVVFLNRYPDKVYSASIVTDNFKGAYMATAHLIDHGYSSIAVIAGPQNIMTGRDRLSGYTKALEDHGLPYREQWVVIGDFEIESGYKAMETLLRSDPKPQAVFVSNNQMTLGAYKYLKENGVAIPRDLAVVGYDDAVWGTVVEPPLTTIRQPSEELGKCAAKHIMDYINGEKTIEKGITYLEPELILRQSCGCPKS